MAPWDDGRSIGGGGRGCPPSLIPAAPPVTQPKDDPFFHQIVEAIASQMAQGDYRVSSGSTIASNAVNGRPDKATHITLWPHPVRR